MKKKDYYILRFIYKSYKKVETRIKKAKKDFEYIKVVKLKKENTRIPIYKKIIKITI